ncbi:MAG: hypothetical protein NVS2B5_30110 [Beijerinckiaceae bacterium]
MLKFTLAVAAAGAIVSLSALGAQAMPAAPLSGATDAPIVHVAGGCGPGFFRGPYGGCRPMGYGPRVVVRRAWGPRPYRWGPRPWRRW